mmetsp:Transcript_11305/g.30553  ORF Transcript_11305/g.30553 Transcript_11305/m.30553 type:complete len:219 (+) Transcript_11305:522-1178(+)
MAETLPTICMSYSTASTQCRFTSRRNRLWPCPLFHLPRRRAPPLRLRCLALRRSQSHLPSQNRPLWQRRRRCRQVLQAGVRACPRPHPVRAARGCSCHSSQSPRRGPPERATPVPAACSCQSLPGSRSHAPVTTRMPRSRRLMMLQLHRQHPRWAKLRRSGPLPPNRRQQSHRRLLRRREEAAVRHRAPPPRQRRRSRPQRPLRLWAKQTPRGRRAQA